MYESYDGITDGASRCEGNYDLFNSLSQDEWDIFKRIINPLGGGGDSGLGGLLPELLLDFGGSGGDSGGSGGKLGSILGMALGFGGVPGGSIIGSIAGKALGGLFGL